MPCDAGHVSVHKLNAHSPGEALSCRALSKICADEADKDKVVRDAKIERRTECHNLSTKHPLHKSNSLSTVRKLNYPVSFERSLKSSKLLTKEYH